MCFCDLLISPVISTETNPLHASPALSYPKNLRSNIHKEFPEGIRHFYFVSPIAWHTREHFAEFLWPGFRLEKGDRCLDIIKCLRPDFPPGLISGLTLGN